MDPNLEHSTQLSTTSSSGSTEKRERTLLVTKLLASYPSRPGVSPEMVLATFLEKTAAVPLPWLREGLRGFDVETDRVFLPSISEILTATARKIRKERLKTEGRDTHTGVAQTPIDVAATLNWAVKHVPLGYAQLRVVCEKRRQIAD